MAALPAIAAGGVSNLKEDELSHLEDLLECNGWTKQDLETRNDALSHVEMFLSSYNRMLALDLFSNLVSLQIIGQSITKIEGLQHCSALKSLWIIEGKLTRIEGLEAATSLTHLYLYSNQLTRIENLGHLTRLEVLWLADNELSTIEGISSLAGLRELHLARNRISRLHGTLDSNTDLRILNLADNELDSFREVQYLAQLPSLQELCLNDPHWGSCPVAHLCNYQTYVLFQLPRLLALDTLLVSEETKQLADATVAKKRMFYNMRIKALARSMETGRKAAEAGLDAQLRLWYTEAAAAHKELLKLERQSQRLQGRAHAVDKWDPEGAEAKRAALAAVLELVEERVRAHEAAFARALMSVQTRMRRHIARTMLELDSGGNIRLEDGTDDNSWYASCRDLVRSRCNEADLEAFGYEGVQVHSVAHVHNRTLKGRYEAAVARAQDAGATTRGPVEYLLWHEHPLMPGELDHVVEHGFRHPEEYARMGLHGAVVLTNSLTLCDAAHLAERGGDFERRRLLVCKVSLGSTATDARGVPVDLSGAHASAVTDGLLWDGPQVLASAFPQHATLKRPRLIPQGSEAMWYAFQPALIVPEYIVHYSYTPTGAVEDTTAAAAAAAALGELPPEATAILEPLGSFLAASAASLRDESLRGAEEGDLAVALKSLDRGVKQQLQCAIDTAPEVPTEPTKLFVITTAAISAVTGASTPASVLHLSLADNHIKRLECLSLLTALRSLTVAHNELLKLDGLSALTALESLDVSHNRLNRIEGLAGLNALTFLDLSHNELNRVDDISLLRKHTSQLRTLDMRMNPMRRGKTYQALATRRLPSLTLLDGQPISPHDRHCANTTGATITANLIFENCTFQQHVPSRTKVFTGDEGEWWSVVESLRLEGCKLRRIDGITKLTQLQEASFGDNQLTSFQGLRGLTTLTSLQYQDNLLTTADGVESLCALRQLDMRQNNLRAIGSITCLTLLTQLSIEDNCITSLKAITSLVNLAELYAGNNKLDALRELLALKELPKLIILDLQGNPMCEALDYHLYAIYQLRLLRVLDGSGISSASKAAAKAKYAGRLTLEFLEDKAGLTSWSQVQELDISGLRIRDVGTVFQGDEFTSLLDLNLSANLLTSATGLYALDSLHVLCLNGNRLSAAENGIFATPKPGSNEGREGRESSAIVGVAAGVSEGEATILPSLRVLQLGGNGIPNIPMIRLTHFAGLRSLFLQSNQIQRVEGLSCLSSLRELVLDRNRIKYLDGDSFLGLTALRELRLEENGLRSPAHLKHLVKLQSLHLGFNRISEPSDLDRLVCLPDLLELSLVNNPIARKLGYRVSVIAKLEGLKVLDGEEITREERAAADLAKSALQTEAPPQAASTLLKSTTLSMKSAGFPQLYSYGNPIPGLLHMQGMDPRGGLGGLEVVSLQNAQGSRHARATR